MILLLSLVLLLSFAHAHEEDPTACGGYGVRCNGSTAEYRKFFYPCCVPRTYCTGLDGYCNWLPGETETPTLGGIEHSDDGCGAPYTRCDGTGLNNVPNFYPCCSKGHGCSGINGTCYPTNVTQPSRPPPPAPVFEFVVPTHAPTSDGGALLRPDWFTLTVVVFSLGWLMMQ